MEKILAIDDDQDVLFTLKAIGEVAKFEVDTCLNGIEAIKILEKEKFDLVIVDYYMPEISGLELVGEIRKINDNIPILVLTVDDSVIIAQRFFDKGATDFATKPIRAADLISRIRVHLKLSKLKEGDFGETIQHEIPKGLNLKTMKLILEHINKLKKSETIDVIAGKTGLAYQTVHRYLSFLEEKGFIVSDLTYGKVGRPIKTYLKKKRN